jgi:tetratricopeptide (TPR) repeat protein
MKNKKTLHEEISRMRLLMEVQLITESRYKAIADVLLSLGDEMADLFAKHSDVILRLRNAVTNEDAMKVLVELINSEKRFADELIPRIYELLSKDRLDLIQKKKNQLAELKRTAPKAVIDDEYIDNYIRDIDFDPFSEIKDVVRKDIKDFLDGVQRAPITVPPSNIPVKVGDDVAEDLKRVFKEWDNISPGTLSATDKFLMNDSWFRGLRSKLKWIFSNTINQKFPFGIGSLREESMKKIVGLLRTAYEDSTKKSAINPELFKLLDLELDALRRDKIYVKNLMYDVIETEVNKATGSFKGRELVENMKKYDPSGPEAESYFKSLLNDNDLIDEISVLFGKIPFLGATKKGVVEGVENMVQLIQRLFGVIMTGYPTSLKTLFKTLRRYGVGWGAMWIYFYFMGMSRIVWPFVFAIKDWLVNSFTQDIKFEETENAVLYFWEEEFKKALGIYNEEFLTIFGNEIPQPYSKILRAMDPFTNIYQKVKDGADYWFTQGGLRELSLDLIENANEDVQAAAAELDSIQAQIRAGQALDSLRNIQNQRRLDSLTRVVVPDNLPGVDTTPRQGPQTPPQRPGRNRQ